MKFNSISEMLRYYSHGNREKHNISEPPLKVIYGKPNHHQYIPMSN